MAKTDWEKMRDKMQLNLRPIQAWPGNRTTAREYSPFSAPFSDTLALLLRELKFLSARSVVLEVDIPESRLRNDGLPYANAVADSPRIILTFGSKHGPLRLWFDRFTHWQHNLRAIAMHLEHLRKASLYGVGQDGQQYTGWKALASPPVSGMTPETAARELVAMAGYPDCRGTFDILTLPSALDRAYRDAAKRVHPDVTRDDGSVFKRLQSIKEMLDRVHGRAT